jgi:hypothetical protein
MSRPTLTDLLPALKPSPIISYVVDVNLILQYCNPAWDRFASENAAPELVGETALGLDLLTVVADDLRPFYLRGFEQAQQSGDVWECLYECSSPQLFRKFHMRVHPILPEGWALVTNTLVIERPHTRASTESLQTYINSDAQIKMCCHCRGSRRADQPEQWDFVPALLDRSITNISHGLCPICLAYFFPKPVEDFEKRH